MPSLEIVRHELDLEVASQERRGSGLDTKAGLVLVAAGVFVGIVPSRDLTALEVAAQLLALLAGGGALWAAFPRISASIEPRGLRDRYLTADPDHSKRRILDTRIHLFERDERRLRQKLQRMRFVVAHALRGRVGAGHSGYPAVMGTEADMTTKTPAAHASVSRWTPLRLR